MKNKIIMLVLIIIQLMEFQQCSNDNTENDPYENNNLTANYGYKISENNTIENSLTLKDSFLKYDDAYKQEEMTH